MTTALVAAAVVLVVVVLAAAMAARRPERHPSILTPGVVRAFRCADCSGSIVAHADWCGRRDDRPSTDRDTREVRGGARARKAVAS